jgi:hypothetical protein
VSHYRKDTDQECFEVRLLREIVQPKKDEVTGCWRKFHNEELHNLHSLADIRMIKSIRMRWAGHMSFFCVHDTQCVVTN